MNNEIAPLVIVGASGFGREVSGLVDDINRVKPTWKLVGLVDDKLHETVEGYPVLGPVSYLLSMDPKPQVVIAIADPSTRLALATRLKEQGFTFASLIHPTAAYGRKCLIGEGTIICRNSILTTNVTLGQQCIINVNCSIGHDTVLGDYVSMMSHTAIGGDVTIGTGSYFGLNCTVINRINIGSWSTFGAGTVVVKDLPGEIVAVGVPAKIIKQKVK